MLFQYQARSGLPLTPDTLPPQVTGMAWYQPLSQPFFPTQTPHWLHQTEMRRVDSPMPLAGIEGISWMRPWEPPYFHGVPAHIQQTEFWEPFSETLPPQVAGAAWYVIWEPPYFPTRVKVELQQTEFYVTNINTLPPTVSGMAWYRQWEPPRFHGFPAELQQTQMQVVTRETLPPITAGMWWKPWVPPFFPKKVSHWVTPDKYNLALTPSTLPPQIAGMAWYRQFDQPKQRRVDVWEIQTQFSTITSVIQPQPYAQVYIIF